MAQYLIAYNDGDSDLIEANDITHTETGSYAAFNEDGHRIALNVRTVHGETAVVRHGDWIIPEAEPGRFYPCKPDIFAATYEAVTD